MKSLFLILVLGFCIANANYTGIWKGEGVLSNSKGNAWYCDDIVVIVSQSSDQFEFGRFEYGCGDLSFNFVPPVLKFDENQNTRWKDQYIGRFTDTIVDFLFKREREGHFSKYTVRREGNVLDYQDDQIYPDHTTSLRAKLYKQ